MAIYIVGDIQGCYNELVALLDQVSFNPKNDELWSVGDIVARGPDSLATIRFLKSLGDSAKVVLGNHDLHLLATFAGLKKVKDKDQLAPLLHADDVAELMEWLAQQPVLRKIPKEDAYMSHAGLSPQWTIKQAKQQAKKIHKRISGKNRLFWLEQMYGDAPTDWHDASTKIEKFRYGINAFTRMRFCHSDKTLDLINKQHPDNAPKNLFPWYKLSNELNQISWVFGHWASLMAQCEHPNVYATDTGCVWGNYLMMIRWHDKKVFKQAALG